MTRATEGNDGAGIGTRSRRPPFDWAAIRVVYEQNNGSIRAIARQHHISDRAIRKRAAAGHWARPHKPDLAFTPAGVNPAGLPSAPPAAPEGPGDRQQPATRAAADPKALIARGLDLAERMLEELSTTTAQIDVLEETIEGETAGDRDGRRRSVMLRAVSLPARVVVLRNLAAVVGALAEAEPGKKAKAKDAAAKVGGSGRFATPPTPPKLVVNNARS